MSRSVATPNLKLLYISIAMGPLLCRYMYCLKMLVYRTRTN
jgi:hypothetical protein